MTMTPFVPLSEGFLLGFGLIIGIGPQNSFIMQQCIKRRFVLLVAVLTSLIDGVLILLGVGGAGAYVARTPVLLGLMTLVGAGFLFHYGFRSLRTALRHRALTTVTCESTLTRRSLIVGLLTVSLLNPSTYLDTLFVIGGSAARYSDSLILFFALGTFIASATWFFGLSFGAARFSGVFHSRGLMRLLDAVSGVIMWFIASRLVMHAFG